MGTLRLAAKVASVYKVVIRIKSFFEASRIVSHRARSRFSAAVTPMVSKPTRLQQTAVKEVQNERNCPVLPSIVVVPRAVVTVMFLAAKAYGESLNIVVSGHLVCSSKLLLTKSKSGLLGY